jgi:DNA-binding transcriptional ArsR family regulator
MSLHDPSLDTLFQALADPTRREMLSRLMDGPKSVTELAEPFEVALPTVLAHLAKLERSGLVETEKQGRTRICRANPLALAPARRWIDDQQALWEGRLDRLDAYVMGLVARGQTADDRTSGAPAPLKPSDKGGDDR